MADLALPSPTPSPTLGGGVPTASASNCGVAMAAPGFNCKGTGAWRASSVGWGGVAAGAGAAWLSGWPILGAPAGSGASALATPAAVMAIAKTNTARFICRLPWPTGLKRGGSTSVPPFLRECFAGLLFDSPEFLLSRLLEGDRNGQYRAFHSPPSLVDRLKTCRQRSPAIWL